MIRRHARVGDACRGTARWTRNCPAGRTISSRRMIRDGRSWPAGYPAFRRDQDHFCRICGRKSYPFPPLFTLCIYRSLPQEISGSTSPLSGRIRNICSGQSNVFALIVNQTKPVLLARSRCRSFWNLHGSILNHHTGFVALALA